MKVKQLFGYFLFLVTIFSLQCASVFAQNTAREGMANLMYESGKIYVVIGVILLIFIGIAIYLFALDRRIKKMEDEI